MQERIMLIITCGDKCPEVLTTVFLCSADGFSESRQHSDHKNTIA